MFVPNVEYYPWMDLDAAHSSGDLHGCIGHEVERPKDDTPRRPIGFVMRPKPPDDPSWLLL